MNRHKYEVGMRIRVRKHMFMLGGGYSGSIGVITEIRNIYTVRPFIIARLETGEIIGLHPEDFVVLKLVTEKV